MALCKTAFMVQGKVMEFLGSKLAHITRDRVWHVSRSGPGPWGKAEDMDMTKAHLFDKGEGFGPFGFGFARKSDDQVGRDIDVGYLAAEGLGQRAKLIGPATPGHSLEYAVSATLQGQMQVWHQTRIVKQLKEVRRNIPGFE